MAKPKRYRIKTRLKTASKVQEKQLLSTSDWLAENPEALIPKCDEQCSRCRFSKIRAKLIKISEERGNETVLKSYSRRGDQLVRAYAATLLAGSKDRARYLAVAKTPDGDIAYIFSPKVRKEKMIGLQYFRDPHLRLLAYADIAKKKRLAIYSTKDELFCSSQGARPPSKFIRELMGRLSLKCDDGGTLCQCGHDLESTGYLEIAWKSARLRLRICESCAQDKASSLLKISERFIDPDPVASFSVGAKVRLECAGKCDDCIFKDWYEFHSDDIAKYLSGEISDRQLFSKAVDSLLDELGDTSSRILVVGRRCFGADEEAFLRAIATGDVEKRALQKLLELEMGPMVIPEGGTTNKLLAQYWERHGKTIMTSLAGAERSETMVDLDDNVTPVSLIEQALARRHIEKIARSLPKYRALGTYSSFIDGIVREYKGSGKGALMKRLELSGTEDTRTKSIGLAFLVALGESGMEWRYTQEERDFARHLSSTAAKLLEASGDEYDRLFRELVRNSGVSEEIVKIS